MVLISGWDGSPGGVKYRAPSGANNDKNGNKGTLHASRQAIVVHGNRKKAKDKCTHKKIYFIARHFSIYKDF